MPHASSTNRTPPSQPPVDRTAQPTTVASQPAGGALSPLIAACVSGFLFQFDLTALSAALPDIASSLSARVADQAWVIDVYSLALIFALPLGGPGRRPVRTTARIHDRRYSLCLGVGSMCDRNHLLRSIGLARIARDCWRCAYGLCVSTPRGRLSRSSPGLGVRHIGDSNRRVDGGRARSLRRCSDGRGCFGSTYQSASRWCC